MDTDKRDVVRWVDKINGDGRRFEKDVEDGGMRAEKRRGELGDK